MNEHFRAPFPKYIDRPRMFGPFEIDEAAFIVVGVGVSLVLGFAFAINVAIALIGGLFGGMGIAMGIKSIKKNFAVGYLYHLAYKKGLRHPVYNNPKAQIKYPELFKKDVKLMPHGFIKTLVE